MLFRIILVALGIYAVRQHLAGTRRVQRPVEQIRNPMFFREGEESEIHEAGRPEAAVSPGAQV
jgi:hypothetical protein